MRLIGTLSVCIVSLGLSGCMSGLDIAGGAPVDKSVSTGSVPSARSSDTISDEVTVRNAVSSADVQRIGSAPIAWANRSSGSAGVINNIAETHDNGTVCRDFTTTRHSYQGIAQFEGRTCLLQTGEWHLMRFLPHDLPDDLPRAATSG